MQTNFTLSCESTVDLPYAYVNGRDIPVLFYSYTVDGTEYPDDMLRDPEALPRFYQFLRDGKLPSTSQINEPVYEDFFEEQLQKGDLLHIVLGSGMTQSVRNAVMAAQVIREKYPERKLIVLDSLGSSAGYGLLVDEAADMRDRGCSIEEVEAWILENRNLIHHQFYSTDLKYFKRSGRVSGAMAMLGSVLNICPIMHLDNAGRIIAYDKVRGKKNAIRRTVDEMAAHAQNCTDYTGKCFISHSNCLQDAEETKHNILERFPKIKEVRITDIGTIIASHSGPGTVAVFFFGDERQPDAAS